MIQHMNLVFGAEGLSVGEGAFLMACCNHTDAKGYVIASMRQIRDEAHLGESAAKSNKKKLISRGLLASAERYHPKNGARVADLYRVNIDAIKQMQRRNTDYGPTLVEELTFKGSQENPSSDPRSDSDGGAGSDSDRGGSDSDGGGSDSDGDAGSDSDPHFLPSSSPSPLPSAAGDEAGLVTGVDERETGAAREDNASVPQQRAEGHVEVTGAAIAEALAFQWRTLHGTAPGRRQLEQIATDAADALADGDDPAWLTDGVAPFMASRRYLDLGRAKTHRECPAPAPAAASSKQHVPASPAEDCADCSGSGWAEDAAGEITGRCTCVLAAT